MNNSQHPLRVLFFGTPEFSAHCLAELLNSSQYQIAAVVTQPDRAAGRGKKLTSSPVKELALKHALPVLQPNSVKRELDQFLTQLEKYGPYNIGVVVAFGQILPQKLLDLPKAGCINVHASILPRWRGAAPIQRAVIAGDKETGVCLMKMEAGLDTGPVYTLSHVTIEENDTSGTLHNKLATAGASLLKQELAAIANGDIQGTPQPHAGVTHAQKISNEEAHIDWSKDAEFLSRLIRGLNPAPGAFTQLRGLRLKIFAATPKTSSDKPALPGSIARLHNSSVEIHCGSGSLSLEEVQLEGKRRMSIEEFLRGGAIMREDLLS